MDIKVGFDESEMFTIPTLFPVSLVTYANSPSIATDEVDFRIAEESFTPPLNLGLVLSETSNMARLLGEVC